MLRQSAVWDCLFFIVNCVDDNAVLLFVNVRVCVCFYWVTSSESVHCCVVLQLHSGCCRLKFSVYCMFIGNNNNIIFVATLFSLPMCGYIDPGESKIDVTMQKIWYEPGCMWQLVVIMSLHEDEKKIKAVGIATTQFNILGIHNHVGYWVMELNSWWSIRHHTHNCRYSHSKAK